MYTLEEIAALRKKCDELKLEGREKLSRYTDEELQVICNGIGPAGLPSFLRRTLNKLHPALEPAALIHDVEFEESDGSSEGFDKANGRFLANGRRAGTAYKWYDLRRYVILDQARRLAALCRRFGGFSWRLAANQNGAEETER